MFKKEKEEKGRKKKATFVAFLLAVARSANSHCIKTAPVFVNAAMPSSLPRVTFNL